MLRPSFGASGKLGQVVVKVIDSNTDKVVREIPPVELQRFACTNEFARAARPDPGSIAPARGCHVRFIHSRRRYEQVRLR
ncbi:MAG: flagellar protein FlaG [Rectinemataceae bacterium]